MFHFEKKKVKRKTNKPQNPQLIIYFLIWAFWEVKTLKKMMWTNPLLLSQAMDYLSGNLSVIMLKKNKQVSLNLVKGKTQRSQSESLSSHKRSRSASSHYPELSIIALNEHSGSSNANLCFSPPDYATPHQISSLIQSFSLTFAYWHYVSVGNCAYLKNVSLTELLWRVSVSS